MKILSNIVFFVLVACFFACFLSLVVLQLANWQLLSIIFLMFSCYLGLYINYKISNLKN